jgi:beta-mannosidase
MNNKRFPMSQSYDLSSLSWTLTGWQPHNWRLAVSMELGMKLTPDVATIPAQVPGSVQQSLRDAGLLPDWTVGLNSKACEWVENRHWQYETTLPADWVRQGGRKVLVCEGLDYRGTVLVNGKPAGTFENAFIPQRFDLTDHLPAGQEAKLSIIFTEIPRYLGQICETSLIRDFKPRFNYVWDWTPRLVQIGIWDAICLEIDPAIDALRAWTEFDERSGAGSLHLDLSLLGEAAQVVVTLKGTSGQVLRESIPAGRRVQHTFTGLKVEPWQPTGRGPQTLYTMSVEVLDASGNVVESAERRVGFRNIVWKQCANAPAGAEPWICNVNGEDLFLQGANWVPIRPNFADVTEADYRKRLTNYRDFGFNLLRIWGGAVLEREIFYNLCDELGILVWQELPYSSSGIDNWPPEDPNIIEETTRIMASYIERRQHHPSLLLWCGGNELQGGLDGSKKGIGKPIDLSHPMMAAVNEVVKQLDPTRRFLATSSTGPMFMADEQNFGKGLHHDVHGPWNHAGDLDGWRKYWDRDDALFRSETGMPGAQPLHLMKHYAGDRAVPGNATNPLWVHISSWWFQWDDYLREGGDEKSIEAYIAWSQKRQADALAHAARKSKARFPGIGGFVLWMGHDCFPCPVNTSVFDYNGDPKPAAHAVKEVFLAT